MTRSGRPPTDGKAERFVQTLLRQYAHRESLSTRRRTCQDLDGLLQPQGTSGHPIHPPGRQAKASVHNERTGIARWANAHSAEGRSRASTKNHCNPMKPRK